MEMLKYHVCENNKGVEKKIADIGRETLLKAAARQQDDIREYTYAAGPEESGYA